MVSTLLMSAVVSARAPAQTNVGLSGGTEYGFGVIATTGTRGLQLEAAGGFAPVLFVATVIGGNSFFNVYLPSAVGAKLSFAINKEGPRRAIKVGATYNSLLKLGFGGGLDAWIRDNIKVGGGIMYYPKALDELVARVNKDDGTNYTVDDFDASLAGVQPFVGFALFFR